MGNKNVMIAIGVLLVVGLVIVILFIAGPSGSSGDGADGGESGSGSTTAGGGTFENPWPDAPDPSTDPNLADQIKNLWPDVGGKKPDREEIQRQWRDFAARYPDNLYLPRQFRKETPEQMAERRKLIEKVTAVEAQLASRRAALNKASASGKDGPAEPGTPTVTPEEQKAYFQYKIEELKSRIQVIEYYLEKKQPSAQKRALGKEEIGKLNTEFKKYEELLKSVP